MGIWVSRAERHSQGEEKGTAAFFSREAMGGKMLPHLGYLSASKQHGPQGAGL